MDICKYITHLSKKICKYITYRGKRYLFLRHDYCVSHEQNILGMNMIVRTFNDFTCVKQAMIMINKELDVL